ncbi:molybdopterin-dependent oxidoreductase [Natrarchaeobaculum sulfurireducens]|uniref:Periplasmic DMSO/TMAO reductase YedYZ n=1 Tax=Natrarchaeobaculum sulfurireducens TaxID=2044521 RepID=A0A346PGI5_9EURY|nr:molybdopterin-dependent oxidoreductase [Natrarchaeobaculum sulfurireducens]AXR78630.1 Periplasmic DMSO/TMAO reductase YedYZ [Natrarchaeobaculum sulfurireducens]
MTAPPSLTQPIELVTDGSTTLGASTLASLPTRERTFEIVCASGDRYAAVWAGVPIVALLEHASVPPETTHLLVESDVGYRVCVPITRALEGLLAFARDGETLATLERFDTRFVGPEIGGPKAVKDVVRLETATLPPGADPDSYEELWPEE